MLVLLALKHTAYFGAQKAIEEFSIKGIRVATQ
jgi:hypothetical protein